MALTREISQLIWQTCKKHPYKVATHGLFWMLMLGLVSVLLIYNLAVVYIYVAVFMASMLSLVSFSHIYQEANSDLLTAVSAIPANNIRMRVGFLIAICILAVGLNQIVSIDVIGDDSVAFGLDQNIKIGISSMVISITTLVSGVYCVAYLTSEDIMMPDNKFVESYTIPLFLLNLALSAMVVGALFLVDMMNFKPTIILPSLFTTLLIGGGYAHYCGIRIKQNEDESYKKILKLDF